MTDQNWRYTDRRQQKNGLMRLPVAACSLKVSVLKQSLILIKIKNMCSFRFKTWFPWVFLPFIFNLLQWTPLVYGPGLNPQKNDSMLLYPFLYLTMLALKYIHQAICAFFVLCIGFTLCLRIQFLHLFKFTLNAFRTSVKTKNVRREEILGIDHFDNHSELDQKIPIQKKDVDIFEEMKQMQLRQSDLLLKEMKKYS